MNLQTLVSSIVEAIIEVDYSENIEDLSIPHETYEDTLALAVINSILVKYNTDLDDQNMKNEDRNKDTNKMTNTARTVKQLSNSASQNPAELISLDINQNSKGGTGTTNTNDNISETSSSCYSDTSSSDSQSSFTSSSSDSSLASTTSPSDEEKTTNKFYDPFIELYLSKSHTDIWETNWTLKVNEDAKQISLSSWRKRLNVRNSLQDQFNNLTDDVKTELEQRNCNVLRNINLPKQNTEQNEEEPEHRFYNSVWFWTSQTLTCQDGEYFVKLGEDIGESSTDDDDLSKCVDDNSLIPVLQAVRMFEALQRNK